jgi:hypothetical protein
VSLPAWSTIADLASATRIDAAELAAIAERLNVDLVEMPGGKRLSPAAQLAVVVAWCYGRPFTVAGLDVVDARLRSVEINVGLVYEMVDGLRRRIP